MQLGNFRSDARGETVAQHQPLASRVVLDSADGERHQLQLRLHMPLVRVHTAKSYACVRERTACANRCCINVKGGMPGKVARAAHVDRQE
eukprot:3281131-Pleurochrysis_carterae.AAC.1